MPSLSSLLTRDAVVDVSLMERAIERQALKGGELDTALLELSATTENVLASYRAASLHGEPVSRAELTRIEHAVTALLPEELAMRLRIVPVALHEGTLVVASAVPLSVDALGRLEAACGCPITVRIGTEVRIAAALERYYGAPLDERLRKLLAQIDTRDPGAIVAVQRDRPGRLSTPSPPRNRTQRFSAVPELGTEPPVQVARVVALSSEPASAQGPDEGIDTRPMRPSKLPPGLRSVRPSALPTTSTGLIDALLGARDRNEVEHELVAHAAQQLACAVVLEVREKHLMGRVAKGLAAGVDVTAIDVPMSRAMQSTVLAGQARVLDLRRDCPGDTLASLLARDAAQPCVLLPITLGRRVVAVLYGDRNGEPLELEDLAELCTALPHVSGAFERILQERKTGALERRSVAPPPPGNDTRRMSNREASFTHMGLGAVNPPLHVAPTTSETSTTVVLPKSNATPSAAPPAPSTAERDDRADTRPERRSSLPPRGPASRVLSQAPPGIGSYALREVQDEVVSLTPPARSERPNRPTSAPPHAHARPSKPAHEPAHVARETHRARPQRADSRREPGDGKVRADIVTMSPELRESLVPPSAGDSLTIDLEGEAERLVDKLIESRLGDEGPAVAGLVRLGSAGLSVLVRRFPGPTWAPRAQLVRRAIAGCDLGPLPRALWAFEDRMVPALSELLEAAHADSRLFAAVLAGDRVHADLLWPLYRRLFDADGSVRMMVAETLPLYRHVPGFGDVLKSLRTRASDARESMQNRLAALEAVAALRDAASVSMLIELVGDSDKQLSVPAHRALIAITAQDFEHSVRKWQAWHTKHEREHRAEWLIESLMHSEERVRAIAGSELQKLTQVYYGYLATAPKRERERARDRYHVWWQIEGKTQFK